MTEINHFFPEKECRKKDVYTAGWQRQNQKNAAWFLVHISIFFNGYIIMGYFYVHYNVTNLDELNQN